MGQCVRVEPLTGSRQMDCVQQMRDMMVDMKAIYTRNVMTGMNNNA